MIIHNNKVSNFEELLQVSVHHNNIHTLATEMNEFVNNVSPETMNEVFK